MSKFTERYQVYTNAGSLRDRIHLGGFDKFADARDCALNMVCDHGVPAIVIDITQPHTSFPYGL